MRNIFLSYSTKDSDAATKIVEGLKAAGHKVWFAPNKILGGENYAENIEEGIEQCELFVLLASKHSIGNKLLKVAASEEVSNEIQLAKKHGLKQIPLKLDDSIVSGAAGGNNYHFIRKQWIDVIVSLESGDFAPIVEQIIATADNIETKSLDMQYIEKAEIDLIIGDFEQSVRALGEYSFLDKYVPRVEFIRLISNLLRKGIKNLNISEADEFTSEFQRLRNTHMASSAAYMLAILKLYCYQPKGFKNDIEDFATLKNSVKSCKPINVKYRFVADKLLPADSQFAVEWLI
jgi:hypothetical protein